MIFAIESCLWQEICEKTKWNTYSLCIIMSHSISLFISVDATNKIFIQKINLSTYGVCVRAICVMTRPDFFFTFLLKKKFLLNRFFVTLNQILRLDWENTNVFIANILLYNLRRSRLMWSPWAGSYSENIFKTVFFHLVIFGSMKNDHIKLLIR